LAHEGVDHLWHVFDALRRLENRTSLTKILMFGPVRHVTTL
jgi:hypothetical protein